MLETHNTPIQIRSSMESMNDAVATLWDRYVPAFHGEELEMLHEQTEDRVKKITLKLWRELPGDEPEVDHTAIIQAYDSEYDL